MQKKKKKQQQIWKILEQASLKSESAAVRAAL